MLEHVQSPLGNWYTTPLLWGYIILQNWTRKTLYDCACTNNFSHFVYLASFPTLWYMIMARMASGKWHYAIETGQLV